MLSRERWTKPSIEDFIAWLETKDPTEQYVWLDTSICACGQYAASIGVEGWSKKASNGDVLWNELNNLAAPWYGRHVSREGNSTFGVLLDRARNYKENITS